MSPLLFAIALHVVLQAVQAAHNPAEGEISTVLMAYHDDCSIAGGAASATAAFRALVTAVEPLGLKPQLQNS